MLRGKEAHATAVGGAILVLAAGASVIALWDALDRPSVDRKSVALGESPPPADSAVAIETGSLSPVFRSIRETRLPDVPGEGTPSVLSDPEAGLWNSAEADDATDTGPFIDPEDATDTGSFIDRGDATDTGPFIDPDDEAGDYAHAPVLDVGDFIDPDAY